jgi:sugar (pentulose or hexulose) kinase
VRRLEPAELYRAAIEGVALNLAWGVERLQSLTGAFDQIRVVGGGAKNPLLRQVLADAIGTEVVVLAEPQSAALGAAMQAAWVVDRRPLAELTERFVKLTDERHAPAGGEPYAEIATRFRALGSSGAT